MNFISENTRDEIAIFITHRFHHLLPYINRILVLKDGSIEEDGQHEELMENHGSYRRFMELQNIGGSGESRLDL